MKPSEITSAKEWVNLPQPEIPVLNDQSEAGAFYEVRELGYYAATKDECLAEGLKADQPNAAMKYVLPIAYVKLDKEFVLCRLPIGLTSWVLRAILIAQRGFDPLPAKLEFGELNGQVFANF